MKKFNKNGVLLLLLLTVLPLRAQSPRWSLGQWHLESLHGQVEANSMYRSQTTTLKSDRKVGLQTSTFFGSVSINTRSYVWHPNFMLLSLDGEIAPGIENERLLSVPYRTEPRTAERLRFHSTFFQDRVLSLNLFANRGRQFINREFTSNIETDSRDYGASINYRNTVLPVVVSTSHSEWDQKEVQNSRRFSNSRDNVRAEVKRSFGQSDRHSLSAAYDEYRSSFAVTGPVKNDVASLNFQSLIPFDSKQTRQLNTLFWFTSQTGNQTFDRLQFDERLAFQLPANLELQGSYQFNRFDQSSVRSRQHRYSGRLEHQLYLSLQSYTLLEYSDLNQTFFDDSRKTLGVGFRYKKIIPGGMFHLNYEFRRQNNRRDSQPQQLHVVDERQQLDDDRVILLDNPFIDPASVVVTDFTGTQQYLENVDYFLVTRGNFLEIQRIVGGRIAPGAEVLLSYQALQQLSYQFNMNNQSVGARLQMLNRFLEVFFRYSEQNFNDISGAEARIFKLVSQRVYGLRFTAWDFSGGIERDEMDSNIIPYNATRYYLTFNRQFAGSARLNITGDWRRNNLFREDEVQDFASLSANLMYNINRHWFLRVLENYRFQQGRGLNLDLNIVQAEISTNFRKAFLTVGLDLFRRDFSGEKINFVGPYARVERRF